MSSEVQTGKIKWVRALLNGILAWVLSIIIYMIPAVVVALKMGFELGPKYNDQARVSSEISESISGMYQNSTWLTFGFIVVMILLILWRARSVANVTADKRIHNGMLVSFFPVILSALFMFSRGFDFSLFIAILFFAGAGYVGGYLSKE